MAPTCSSATWWRVPMSRRPSASSGVRGREPTTHALALHVAGMSIAPTDPARRGRVSACGGGSECRRRGGARARLRVGRIGGVAGRRGSVRERPARSLRRMLAHYLRSETGCISASSHGRSVDPARACASVGGRRDRGRRDPLVRALPDAPRRAVARRARPRTREVIGRRLRRVQPARGASDVGRRPGRVHAEAVASEL